MKFTAIQLNKIKLAEIETTELVFKTVEEATDLIGNLYYQGYDGMLLYENQITPDFFNLETGFAGEILQKISNFRMRLVVIGEVSKFSRKSQVDFIHESNKGKTFNFFATLDEALKVLNE